ncbi:MAG: hypothetical protein ACKOJC_07620 [Actinomycetota bacterium]
MPDLLDIQRKSFEDFLAKGLAETFRDISPITDFSGNLILELTFDPTDERHLGDPKFSPEECREKGPHVPGAGFGARHLQEPHDR